MNTQRSPDMQRIKNLAQPRLRQCKLSSSIIIAAPEFKTLREIITPNDALLRKPFEFNKLQSIYMTAKKVNLPRFVIKNNLVRSGV